MPNLYIIAGCNGAGKTTAALTLLPELLDCKEFVNADAIAAGISPFNPESVAFEAGRLMLQRIRYLLDNQLDFAFETTLSTRSYAQLVNQAKNIGYEVTLIFFWLESVTLAKERVKSRVTKGGHHVPEEVIERRYQKGLVNLIKLFIPICDEWLVYDNSTTLSPIAIKEKNEITIYQPKVWEIILANI